jgi:hypothetical protein
MNDKEKEEIELTLKKLDAWQRHVNNYRTAANILARKLIEIGRIRLGLQLIAGNHDGSKLTSYIEWNYLFQEENKELLQLAIQEHQSTNPHHLEYWGDTEHIPRLHLAELVADTFSRSNEFGKDYWDYMKNTFFPEHNIKVNSRTYKIIKEFADLLVEKPFEPIKV